MKLSILVCCISVLIASIILSLYHIHSLNQKIDEIEIQIKKLNQNHLILFDDYAALMSEQQE